jgi:hypothetical protein
VRHTCRRVGTHGSSMELEPECVAKAKDIVEHDKAEAFEQGLNGAANTEVGGTEESGDGTHSVVGVNIGIY